MRGLEGKRRKGRKKGEEEEIDWEEMRGRRREEGGWKMNEERIGKGRERNDRSDERRV